MDLVHGTKTKGVCTVNGCKKPRRCRGLCEGHYWRWRTRKPGDLPFDQLKSRPYGGTPALDFLEVALKSKSTECIIWPFAKNRNDYPMAHIDGEMRRLNRWVCILKRGAPPNDDSHAAHKCGNASCINWRHIRWRSPFDNIQEKYEHGTQTRGERIFQSKLTERQALAIFNSKKPTAALALKYGVSTVTINRIRSGSYGGWAWLTKGRKNDEHETHANPP